MTTLRTFAVAALLGASVTLAHAGKDCSMTADGDDLVAPPVKSATKSAEKSPAAERQAVSTKATKQTAKAEAPRSVAKAETKN
jgi:hypothetical protein